MPSRCARKKKTDTNTETVYCPVASTLSLIGGKYKTLILWNLFEGPQRYSQLHNAIKQATSKMLTQQLRELERDGLIHREVFPVIPPRVEYSLTERGASLKPVLRAMYRWGKSYLSEQGLNANCGMQTDACADVPDSESVADDTNACSHCAQSSSCSQLQTIVEPDVQPLPVAAPEQAPDLEPAAAATPAVEAPAEPSATVMREATSAVEALLKAFDQMDVKEQNEQPPSVAESEVTSATQSVEVASVAPVVEPAEPLQAPAAETVVEPSVEAVTQSEPVAPEVIAQPTPIEPVAPTPVPAPEPAAAEVATHPESEAAAQPEPTPAKRPRGRPRKQVRAVESIAPLPEAQAPAETSAVPTPESAASAEPNQVPVKRRRGRPRKVQPTAPTSEPTAQTQALAQADAPAAPEPATEEAPSAPRKRGRPRKQQPLPGELGSMDDLFG